MIVPLIEKMGKITEINLPEPPRGQQPGAFYLSNDGTRYELCRFVARIHNYKPEQKHLVYVDIYIHPQFQGDVKPDFRFKVLEQFIFERAAWFFSYGQREKQKDLSTADLDMMDRFGRK